MRILVIDNYDSFVENLARMTRNAGRSITTTIIKNDEIDFQKFQDDKPDAVIISPGPCKPSDAGDLMQLLPLLDETPTLGVCLGHQALGEYYGAKLTKAIAPIHGQNIRIRHNSKSLFKGIPDDAPFGLYHALAIAFTDETKLQVTATALNGEIMAFQHVRHPHFGIQFHPESFLSEPYGQQILKNFLSISRQYHRKHSS